MSTPVKHRRMAGVGLVRVAVAAGVARAAAGRSFVSIAPRFNEAPVAYSLSAVAAVVYILATLALMFAGSRAWYRIAWIALGFELSGVIVVGALSLLLPEVFQHPTVWSVFGMGYLFIPVALPIIGMWWLVKHPPEASA
mgnify:FL=1